MMGVGEAPVHVGIEHRGRFQSRPELDDAGPRGETPPMKDAGPIGPASGVGMFVDQDSVALASMVLAPAPAEISTLRGLACSATGIVTLRTPFSYDASTPSASRPSPRKS